MRRLLRKLGKSYASPPLIGTLYNLAPEVDLPLVFVATDTMSERALQAVRDLRSVGDQVCVVVFYNGADPEQEILALEAGADDCIPMPADLRYFEARLRATASRLGRSYHPQRPAQFIEVNPLTHQAQVDGHHLPASPLEFRFLLELCRQRGRMVSREHLEQALWGEVSHASSESLKALVHRLRLRLGPDAGAIITVPGVGYRIE